MSDTTAPPFDSRLRRSLMVLAASRLEPRLREANNSERRSAVGGEESKSPIMHTLIEFEHWFRKMIVQLGNMFSSLYTVSVYESSLHSDGRHYR